MSEARVNQTKLQSDVLHAAHMFYEKQSSSFRENVKLLDAYSPLKILARGYGAVYDEQGKYLNLSNCKLYPPTINYPIVHPEYLNIQLGKEMME